MTQFLQLLSFSVGADSDKGSAAADTAREAGTEDNTSSSILLQKFSPELVKSILDLLCDESVSTCNCELWKRNWLVHRLSSTTFILLQNKGVLSFYLQGFLIESKLNTLLTPLGRDDQSLMKLDAIFAVSKKTTVTFAEHYGSPLFESNVSF